MERKEFDGWAQVAGPRLHRVGYLLTGDWGAAEDLVQHALVATWRRFDRLDAPEAFARTVMARGAASRWRRKWHGEIPHGELPEPHAADPWSGVDTAHELRAALLALPARQRAVVVLRFLDDMSEAETAAALGWPAGTVKSTCARALAALRAAGTDNLEVQR